MDPPAVNRSVLTLPRVVLAQLAHDFEAASPLRSRGSAMTGTACWW
jgi:hypothetical protein